MPNEPQLPFFVYGTLLPDQPNFSLWGTDIAQMAAATLHGGKLYDMGYYPMLVSAEVVNIVSGMVITPKAAAYASVRQRLDMLEGFDPAEPDKTGYQRRAVEVQLVNGRSQTAWVYQGQPALVVGKAALKNGDWAAYAAQNQPTLKEWWDAIQTVAGLHTTE